MFTTSAPAAVQTLTIQESDRAVAQAWGFTDWQWAAMTQTERVEMRTSVAYAPNLCTEGK